MHIALLTARCILCREGCRKPLGLEWPLPVFQDVSGMLADTETEAGTALLKVGESFALRFESFVLGPFKAFYLYIT